METSLTTPGRAATPRMRVLSLGAGPQTSTLLLLACEGRIPKFDAAIFADPGWLHPSVSQRITRLTQIAADAGIPLYRVSAGNVRSDALDRHRRFASMPLWYRSPAGRESAARRQCVSQYKTRPIKAKIRELLGYPPPARVPAGIYAELAIGLTAGETSRARDPDVRYLKFAYPLADLGWSTSDCVRYLVPHGMTGAPLSTCLGCPHHGNRWWRYLRDHEPDQWADVVAFDHAIRHGHPRATSGGQKLRGRFYLHMSRQSLDRAHLGPTDVLDGQAGYAEDGVHGGCSPWANATSPALPSPSSHRSGTSRTATVQRYWVGTIRLAQAVARWLTTLLSRHRKTRQSGTDVSLRH